MYSLGLQEQRSSQKIKTNACTCIYVALGFGVFLVLDLDGIRRMELKMILS
jgi:hypothetical protein